MKNKTRDLYDKFKINSKKYFSTNILFSSFVIISLLIGLVLRINTVGTAFMFKPLFGDFIFLLIII